MASGPITSWQIYWEKVETVKNLIFLYPKITTNGECTYETKRHLLLGRNGMTNLDSILKSKDIILPTKDYIVKSMVFPVIIYGCENWTIKKAERWRTDAFELQCWRGLFRVPWTTGRSNQSVLKEINKILNGRTDAENKAPILWPPDAKSRLNGIDPDAGKDQRQKEKSAAEDEMVR